MFLERRARLALDVHQPEEAERLACLGVERLRTYAATPLTTQPDSWSSVQRRDIMNLTMWLNLLGTAQMRQGKAECVVALEEDYELSRLLKDQSGAAKTALHLGSAYKDIAAIRNLKQAKRWYRRSIEMRPTYDFVGLSNSFSQLGQIAYLRFQEVHASKPHYKKWYRYLDVARSLQHQALSVLTEDNVPNLAVVHHHLGVIYSRSLRPDLAFYHLREALRYEERQNNVLGAADTRSYIAEFLASKGQYEDALLYAREALNNYSSHLNRNSPQIRGMTFLITELEQRIRSDRNGAS